MSHFDDWVTDPAVTRAQVQEFLADPHNVGRDFQDRYVVCTTSGATGIPAILLHDHRRWSSTTCWATSARCRWRSCLAATANAGRVPAFSPVDAPGHRTLLLPTQVVHDGRAKVRPPRAGYSRLSRDRRAALVIVLIRKWLQPSGFTQNVQRTHGIVNRQGMIFQSVGVITSHSPHDNAPDRRARRGAKVAATRSAMCCSGLRVFGAVISGDTFEELVVPAVSRRRPRRPNECKENVSGRGA